VSVIDTMPLVRLVVGCRGRVPMRTELTIRFGYGLVAPWIERADDDVFAVSGPDALRLSTPVDVAERDRCAQADFVVSPGERVPCG
jgi:hypothetical protein